jgi:hypothetical protein
MQKRLFLFTGLILTILAVAIFASNLSVVESYPNASVPATALHTFGHQIINSNGNAVYFRGIGRAGDIDSMTGFWTGKGMLAYDTSQSWQTDTATLTKAMDETFVCYRDVWKVNLIRIFVPVDWWWQDKINPYLTYGQGPNFEMSYQNYIVLLIEQAQKYGLYVDFCPYEVNNIFINNDAWDGIPGSLGNLSMRFMYTISPDEMKAWQVWWTNVANRLGNYPNLIFEMWNEPDDGTVTADSSVAQAFFNYSIQSYKAIRATGVANLVFIQWHAGFSPTGADLTWIPQLYNQLKDSLKRDPVNVAFTAHPYRRGPVPNLQWATTYSGVQSQLNQPNMIPATRSNGVDVPLVFNEMGVMRDPSVYNNDFFPEAQQLESNLSFDLKFHNELAFWNALLWNAKAMGVGVCAYYWMQNGVWWGWEALVEGEWAANSVSPTPTQAGQIFINSYFE